MGFFKAKKEKGIKKPGDSLGGFTPLESDIYELKITAAYGVDSSKSDAQGIRIEAKIQGTDRKIYETHWISSGEGKVTSEYNGKVTYKKGYLLMDALALLATEGEAGILELETEEKTIKMKRDGKDVNETVDSFPDLIGFEFKLGIVDALVYKQNNVDGEWKDTEEVEHRAQWHTLFDLDGFTLNELESEAEEPAFEAKWLAAWKGKTRELPAKKTAPKAKGKRSSSSEESPADRKSNRRAAIRGR